MPPSLWPMLTTIGRVLERARRALLADPTALFGSRRVVVSAGRYRRQGARARALLPLVRSEIDTDRFAALVRKHGGKGDCKRKKYLELDKWLRRHLTHAEAIGLFDGRPRRILDIGTGNGYFPLIATRLGHEVVGTDIDTVSLYDDLVALMGIRRVVHAVDTFRPLPDFGGRFDLVTAFNTVFDRIDESTTWTPREWDFFLQDIREHVLHPQGEIVLKLNPNRRRVSDERAVVRFFRSLGADVALPFVHLRVEDGRFVLARRGWRASAPPPGASRGPQPVSLQAA